jgi:hypothetical protein
MSRSQKTTTNSGSKKQDTKVVIIVAIIGIAGTIIAAMITAVFGYVSIRAQIEEPIKYTQTAEIKLNLTNTQIARITNTPTPIPTPTALFEDDFSSDQGWVDLSNGVIHRDVSNQWLEWATSRDSTHRCYIPINAQSGYIQLDYRFNVSSFNGNGSAAFGLAENLDAPTQRSEVDATGFFTRIVRFDNTNWIYPLSIYQDNTYYEAPRENWINFSNLNTWYRVSIEINNGAWAYTLMDDSGNPLGQLSGTLPQQHSQYRYLLLVFDRVGGWESASGLLDDIKVYDQTH